MKIKVVYKSLQRPVFIDKVTGVSSGKDNYFIQTPYDEDDQVIPKDVVSCIVIEDEEID